MPARSIDRPVDLCVYSPVKPKYTESDRVAMRWSKLIARSNYSLIREVANDVYWAVAMARCDCPSVSDLRGGLLLAWEDNNRVLRVRVVADAPVSYALDTTGATPKWETLAVGTVSDTIFFRLARYVSGQKESVCHEKG